MGYLSILRVGIHFLGGLLIVFSYKSPHGFDVHYLGSLTTTQQAPQWPKIPCQGGLSSI